ncbi:MAG: hypothetical protein QE271_02475 [Bacteriovoracaceae bacterium]|nr:hypothetical protein [Bacteriovoracaceae bacterium]
MLWRIIGKFGFWYFLTYHLAAAQPIELNTDLPEIPNASEEPAPHLENRVDSWITRWAPSELANDDFFIRNAFSKLIEQRCTLYSRRDDSCFLAANSLVDFLDYQHVIPPDFAATGKFYRIIFQKKLIRFMNSPKTTKVFEKLWTRLNEKSSTLYLFEEIKSILGSKEKAMEFIAVIFQDFSNETMPLNFLRLMKSSPSLQSIALKNLSLYEKILPEFVFQVYGKTHEIPLKPIKFFPIGSILNNLPRLVPQAYHFYVPAYLALLLRKQAQVNREDSKKVAFLFNYMYEVFTDILVDGNVDIGSGLLNRIMGVIEPPLRQEFKFNDVYMAWDGVVWSIDDTFTPVSLLEQFKNGLSRNPKNFFMTFFQ